MSTSLARARPASRQPPNWLRLGTASRSWRRTQITLGGIARTVHYRSYRQDIVGHRFVSKSSEITEWWHKRLPDDFISVNRLSRIYDRGKFFAYPLKAANALFGLEIFTSAACLLRYLKAQLVPIQPEKSFAGTNRHQQRELQAESRFIHLPLRLLVEMSGWAEHKGIFPSQMHNLRGQFCALCYQKSPLLTQNRNRVALSW